MEILIYKQNEELSKDMCYSFFEDVMPKQCFGNVGKISTNIDIHKWLSSHGYTINDLKICYGAWNIPIKSIRAYCKHCFFKIEGNVIDPTYYTRVSKYDTEYLIAKEYSYEDYIDMLIAYDGDANLDDDTAEEYLKLANKLKDLGYMFM